MVASYSPRPPDPALILLLGYASLYLPDASELALPDAGSARSLLSARRPDVLERLEQVTTVFSADEKTRDATVLATARLGLRHGSLGDDFHAYHNECHVLEVCERRLSRMLEGMGAAAPGPRDIEALMMFAACHDLRQRETVDVPGPVGGNEAASISESFRILDACNFNREGDRDQFVALELMIAGSTFDARPSPGQDAQTEELPCVAGGALARCLALWLDSALPRWRHLPEACRGERLARLAADLDTANVGESFEQLCATALRLCREREMRAGRQLDQPESALPCLGFLGLGQEAYFFELHRFNSREGERVFGPQKLANANYVRDATAALLARFAERAPSDGAQVLAAYSELTGAS